MFVQFSPLKFCPVVIGYPPPRCRPFIQVWKFHSQNRRLDFIEAKISADEMVVISRLHPVLPAMAQVFGKSLVLANYHPGIAGCSQVFRGIKAKRSRFADRPG